MTYKGDYEAPDDEYLNSEQISIFFIKKAKILGILQTLAGRDEETRSEVGFRTILVKMQYSDSLKKWNYIVKNLIILDRCIEDKFFLQDISELDFPHIKGYKDDDSAISN